MTTSQLLTPVPAHIPSGAVYDFDMHRDSGLLTNPDLRILQLLKEAPDVFWTPRNGGHWVIIGYEAIFEATHDPKTFSSNFPQMLQSSSQLSSMMVNGRRIPNFYPICLDSPDHGRYRAPLQKLFSPKVVSALKNQIQMQARDLIETVSLQGHCDGINDIAEPLHFMVFLSVLGLPTERLQEFSEINKKFKAPFNHPSEMVERMWMVLDAMRDVVLARREQPQNDLISRLWQIQVDGAPMTYEDMENYGVVLFTAGLDTPVKAMGHGIRHLAIDTQLQAQLRSKPELVAEIVEETLRRYTFVLPSRTIMHDTEFRNRAMKRGEVAVLFLPSTGLDERMFPSADLFDIHREEKAHIAFGAGPHRCVGSHLARIELQALYEAMATCLPPFKLTPDKPVKLHAGHVLGMDELPLTWS